LKFKQTDLSFTASASAVITGTAATIPISVLKAAPYSLAEGATIKATVVAVNSVGSSAASAEGGAAVIPTTTVADAPTSLAENVALRTKTQTGLTWAAPSNNGGSTVTGYNVLQDNVVVGTNVQTTSHTAINLVLGTTYTFKVTANNAKG